MESNSKKGNETIKISFLSISSQKLIFQGEKMSKIITFGEIMLRLAPSGYYRIIQADTFGVTFGGAEANVAVSLAHYGEDVSFVTKLPLNPISDAAINSLRRYGVNTKHIVRGGERIGIYYLEKGASQRGSAVIYDRKYSAIQQADLSDFDFNEIFQDAEWFHFTGITPAISNAAADICLQACRKAKEKKIKVSCDLNYRNKLWTKEAANRVMTELMQYVDICIANEEDAANIFGICADSSDVNRGKIDKRGYETVATELQRRFNFELVAITLRNSITANDNKWSAILWDGAKHYQSKEYAVHLVDRVGGGDAFGAGLIYTLLNNYDYQSALEFAVAAGCLKQTVEGDYNQMTIDEVLKLVDGNVTGRISR